MGAPILAPFFWTLTVITEYCTQLHYTSNGTTIVEFLPGGGGEGKDEEEVDTPGEISLETGAN